MADNTCQLKWCGSTGVWALGAQVWTYSYDGLSRLTAATTPEEGAAGSPTGTTYFYYTTSGGGLCAGDPNAVCRRTDARSKTTTYTYDALNRLTGKTYSDSTPAVSYLYDQTDCLGLGSCYNRGRRTGMSDGSGQTAWAYDAAGRTVKERRTMGGVTKEISYTHNLAGLPTSILYPSGLLITYNYNDAGRAVSGSMPGMCLACDAHYAPHGAVSYYAQGDHGLTGVW